MSEQELVKLEAIQINGAEFALARATRRREASDKLVELEYELMREWVEQAEKAEKAKAAKGD
jgi:hypothetical protein